MVMRSQPAIGSRSYLRTRMRRSRSASAIAAPCLPAGGLTKRKLAADGPTSKPCSRRRSTSHSRSETTWSTIFLWCASSSIAATAAAMAMRSTLYEPLTAASPAMRSGLPRGHSLMHAAQGLEQWIGWRRVRNAIAGARERTEAHLDELVAAVAERDLLRLYMVVGGDGVSCRRRGRARIQAQLVVGRVADRLEHSRRRWERRLVGVELHPPLAVRRLLAGEVGVKVAERLLQEAFLHSRRKVSKASRGLTFCSR